MKQRKSLTIKAHRRTILFALLLVICLVPALAQTGNVKGQILDETGASIIGANIREKGTNNGTVTDINGNYSISVNNPQTAVLIISYVGYVTVEESVAGRTTINLTLRPSAVDLGEVVVVGYGTQSRREITGSIANVSEADFNKGIVRDAADLLQGKVAGLTITSGSGDVTRGSQIRLRGTSTLMNDQGPMIVIDGIPGGDMSTVAPTDIESISVLKDASSAAIYGSRAAGGVILITTKRGSASKVTINYNGYITAETVANKPDLLNAAEWRALNKERGTYDTAFDQYTADTDWFGALLRTGFSQNQSVSLSGGSPKSNYRASYTFLKKDGIAKSNYMNRHNFRFQLQQRAINDKLRISLTGSGTMSEMQFPYTGDFIWAYNNPPVYPIKNEDGSWFTDNFGKYDQGNPVQNLEENYNIRKTNYFYGSGDVLFTPLEGLDVKAFLYKSRFSADNSEYQASTNRSGRDDKGYARRQGSTYDREVMEWTANYEKAFGKEEVHKVSAVAGYSWEINVSEGQQSIARDFAVNTSGAYSIQAGNSLKLGDVTSYKNSYKLISFYARAHYGFAEKYMVTATIRRDGSSKFGKNHQWGIFPSVSAAWSITQEKFMKNVSWITDLKLRAGYGVTGNQDGLTPYRSLELYAPYDTYYLNDSRLTAYRVSQNPNPELKWEETAMLNIGLDFTLFKGRVSGTIEWYDKRTSDMLYRYQVPTPPYVYDRMYANVGDMSNKGIELMVNIDVVRNRNFSWSTSINASHNKNEITRLSNELYSTSRIYTGDPWIRGASGVTSHVIEEGYPVGQFFMLKCLGIDKDGKYIMADIDPDGQITDSDRTYVGSAQPDLTFGWNNTFRYKQWDAGFFIRGTIGNDVLNNPLAAYGNNTYLSGYNVIKNKYLNILTESSRVCSFYVEDASFARLDNMSIGYTFNTKNINWLDKARIYVAAQNLFVITGYTGLDPELELFRGSASDNDAGLSPGIEPRNYFPKARSFTFGVNLTF